MEPALKTQMELEAHEKECAIRYAAVQERLDSCRQAYVASRGYDYGKHCFGGGYGRLCIYGD